MILERLDVAPAELERRTGWTIRPEGACRAGECVPLDAPFDVRELAQRLGMALVEDTQHGLWALGPESGGHALASAELPDIALPDRHGRSFALRSLLGTKVLMITWASWCGCRSDLPGWRKLREELNPGVICVGAAIRDHSGAVVGAISASAPTMRTTEDHLALMREEVVAASRALSAELGGVDTAERALAG